jgi:hypothetical protein
MTKYYTINGVTLNQTQWAERLGITRSAISLRLKKGLKRGWPLPRALLEPGHPQGGPGRKRLPPPEIGSRFGRWTVLGPAEMEKNWSCSWCRCDCGAERIIPDFKLRTGGAIKCGKRCPGHKAPKEFQQTEKSP